MLRPYCCFFNCQIKYFFLICHGAYFMLSFIYLSCIFIFSIDQVWSCSPLPLSSTFPTEGQICLSPTSFSTVSALDGWKGTRVKKKFALGHTTAIELFRGMEVTAIFYNNIQVKLSDWIHRGQRSTVAVFCCAIDLGPQNTSSKPLVSFFSSVWVPLSNLSQTQITQTYSR